MSRLLTKEERQDLTPSEKKALRRKRSLERWPDTNGRPPWLVRGGDVLKTVGQKAAIILTRAAIQAVLGAAGSTLNGGQLRHEFAVDKLLETAAGNAVTLGRDEASGLIADTYEILDLDGRP